MERERDTKREKERAGVIPTTYDTVQLDLHFIRVHSASTFAEIAWLPMHVSGTDWLFGLKGTSSEIQLIADKNWPNAEDTIIISQHEDEMFSTRDVNSSRTFRLF